MSKFISDSLVSRCRFAALLGLLGLLGHVAGCGPGGDPNVAKARAVLEETISKNPEFERFAISNAKGTRSEELLSLIEAGIQSDNFQPSIDAIHAPSGRGGPAKRLRQEKRGREARRGHRAGAARR